MALRDTPLESIVFIASSRSSFLPHAEADLTSTSTTYTPAKGACLVWTGKQHLSSTGIGPPSCSHCGSGGRGAAGLRPDQAKERPCGLRAEQRPQRGGG